VSYKKWDQAEVGETYNGMWLIEPVAFFLSQTNPKAIAPLLDAMSVGMKTNNDYFTPDIHEIVVRNILTSEPPADELLTRLPFGILWVGASPDGQVIAFTADTPEHPSLYVIPRVPHAQATLVDEGVREADWSTDGQNLVYAKTTVPYELLSKSVQLGTITSRQVCGTNDQLLGEFPPAKDLAGLLLGGNVTRVACLPDGRILFAAAPVHLPAITADMPSQLTLFALPAGATQSVVSVVLPADIEHLPNRADRFVLSPDKKKVAIPGNAGQVSILFLDSGKLVTLQASDVYTNTQDSDQLVPSWRNTNEIALVVPVGDPAGSTNRVEAVLASLSGSKTLISRSWTTNMAKQLLPASK
jgi:dipeptidyl aminopeptidase/acylaminoacyl peptidase